MTTIVLPVFPFFVRTVIRNPSLVFAAMMVTTMTTAVLMLGGGRRGGGRAGRLFEEGLEVGLGRVGHKPLNLLLVVVLLLLAGGRRDGGTHGLDSVDGACEGRLQRLAVQQRTTSTTTATSSLLIPVIVFSSFRIFTLTPHGPIYG